MARTRYVIGLVGLATAALLTGCGSSEPATPTPTRPTWPTPTYTPTYSPAQTTEAEFEDADTSTTTATKRARATPRTTTTARRAPAPKKTSAYYANCAAARAAGAAPLSRGQAGYRAGLDRDGDGIACEN